MTNYFSDDSTYPPETLKISWMVILDWFYFSPGKGGFQGTLFIGLGTDKLQGRLFYLPELLYFDPIRLLTQNKMMRIATRGLYSSRFIFVAIQAY